MHYLHFLGETYFATTKINRNYWGEQGNWFFIANYDNFNF